MMTGKYVGLRNKRAVMTVAALLILFFHLWVPFTRGNTIEQFILKTGYIGVDAFFLVSAYSIGSRKVEDYKSFVKGRFVKLYPKFLFFALLALFVGSMKSSKFVQALLFVDFFKSGGGAFLWFVPAILIMYLWLPLYQRLHLHYERYAFAAVLLLWAGLGLAVTNLTSYRAIFIAYNRIPAMLFGYHMGYAMAEGRKKGTKPLSAAEQALVGAFCLVTGGVLLYFFGYRHFQNVPIYNIFYVIAVPATLGLTLLCDLIPKNSYTDLLGGVTLELYGMQMAAGYKIAGRILKLVGNKLAANIITLSVVTLLSVLTAFVFEKLYSMAEKRTKSKQH